MNRTIAVLAIALVAGTAAAQGASGFFKNRSAKELAALDHGDILVGKLSDWRKMGLGATGATADRLRARIAGLRPNYITEFMAEAPADAASLERLRDALSDVKDYVSIVYISPKYNAAFPLFDRMTIKSRSAIAGGEKVESTQHMQPFEDFDAEDEYSLSGDELFFESLNASTLKYFGHSAVQPHNMVWSIYAIRSGDRCYFYGIGAMGIFDFFGAARDRLEPSFLGRVESFMKYMCGKMQGASKAGT